MKILLLNPPAPNKNAFIREGRCTQVRGAWATLWPPITLATAGAMLEAQGHHVEIIDCAARGIGLGYLLKGIRKIPYALIAWSSGTPSIKSDLSLAKEIKRVNSGVRTATFGTHVTALAQACLNEAPDLDFVIRNEPEESLVALVRSLENKSEPKDVKGISYRNADGKILHNPKRPFMDDLDALPFPAWHLLDLTNYKLPLTGEKFLILAPTRGCPYSCTFCTAQTYYGRKLRKKSVQRMMDEIEYNMDRFHINQFFIWADTFTADKDYAMRFCHGIRARGFTVHWTCNSRVDTVDQNLLKTMAKAGCWMISYGIESGNEAVLNSTGKHITPDQSRIAVKMAKEAGIKVAGHFVLGLPGEDEKTLKETVDLALTLDMDMAQFYCAVPFPGSSLYQTATDKGWIEGRDFDEFQQDNAVMNQPGLPASVVNEQRKAAFRRFYLKPANVLRILDLIKGNGIGNTIKTGVQFLGWTRS